MRYLATLILALFVMAVIGPPIVTQCLDMPGSSSCLAGTSFGAGEETEKDSEESDEDTPKLVRSKRERRVERRNNWIEGLEGDKARIYELYGYPSGKYREEVMGAVIERWVYPEHGMTFKFKGNKLTR